MNKATTIIAFVLLVIICATVVARTYIPLPSYTGSNISQYRTMLTLSTSRQAQAIRRELGDAPQELALAKANAVAAGIVLTPPSTPPNGPNAAQLYIVWKNARKAKKLVVPRYGDPLVLNVQYTPEEVAAVAKLYDDNRELDLMMMKAIDTPAFYASSELSGTDPGFTVYAPMREAARETTTKATLLALRGKWTDAAKAAISDVPITYQLYQDHSIIGNLVGDAIESISLADIESLLAHDKPDASLAALFVPVVAKFAGQDQLSGCLRYGGIETMNEWQTVQQGIHLGDKTDVSQGAFTAPDREIFIAVIDVNTTRQLNTLASALKHVDEPRAQRRTDFAAIDLANTSVPIGDPAAELFGSSLEMSQLAKKDDVLQARIQVTLAACAVLTVKANTGSYPETLPGNFADPFSNKQLVYKVTNKGFIIYSVGPSGTFDGDVAHKTGWDQYFIYPAPPPKPVPVYSLGTFPS